MADTLITLKAPYLLFLGDVTEPGLAKTALGIHEWRPALCAGQMRLEGCTVDLGLPDLTPQEAVEKYGAQTLVIGVANIGGFVPESWLAPLCTALESGLDIAAGLHTRLNDIAILRETARHYNRTIQDVRQTSQVLKVGTGRKRTGKRLLTVAADCAIGKKYTALAIAKEMEARGLDADFRATGQTGIFISGSGICVDAVVADFISGAAEALSPSHEPDHWDIIEGQGSLFHPAYAGVSLGLLHGSQPDALVLCHDATRTHVAFLEGFPLPPIEVTIQRCLEAARLTNPDVQMAGVSVNTSSLNDDAAALYMAELHAQLGLPVCDPLRTGVSDIVDLLEAQFR